jgi:CRISPR/Cas system-associated protein endoribonuclease Cas2
LRDRLKEQDRKSSEIELEEVRQRFGVRRIQADKFAQAQFDIYLEICETLSALQLAVNAVWDTVTKQNITTLLRQLRTTEQRVNASSLLFEEVHLNELKRLFSIIENFTTGKLSLAEIRSKNDLDFIKIEEIKLQVEENYQYKDQLKHLLEDLMRSFHKSLSGIERPDAL